MPKHGFAFPNEVIVAVKQHVRRAVGAVSPRRFNQEATYTAALMARLDGIAYEGQHGSVRFTSTVFDDRGKGTAESLYGADYSITGTISDGTTTINKAILVQVKLGQVSELDTRDMEALKNQIRKMRQILDAPKVMDAPEIDGRRVPAMISGHRILRDQRFRPMDFVDYFTARVTTTLDGCTNGDVISAVQDSSMPNVRIRARIETIR